MVCGSGCCGPPKDQDIPLPPTNLGIEEKEVEYEDGCCSENECIENSSPDSNEPPLDQSCDNAPDLGSINCGPLMDTTNSAEATSSDDCCVPKSVTEPACAKGCCSKTTDKLSQAVDPHETYDTAKLGSGACGDGCCTKSLSSKQTVPNNGTAYSSEAPTSDCRKDCCSGSKAVKDDRRNPSLSPKNDACQKGCCSQTKILPASTQSDAPPCCAGKPAPCCDDSCIERLALRKCESFDKTSCSSSSTKVASTKPSTPFDCHKGASGNACTIHLREARRQYQDKLKLFGCICRSLIARGQESCCPFPDRPFSHLPRPPTPCSRGSVDSCCAVNNTCGLTAKASTRSDRSCSDRCCASPKSDAIVETTEVSPEYINSHLDIEKGSDGNQHVVLSISGMTCTGCETKLKRTLGMLPAVRNLKTSLVLARAEFDLELQLSSPEDVIKHLQRTTEFKCERVTSQGWSFDLLCTSDALSFVKGNWPHGVIDMRPVDKKTVRVDYDAKLAGARELIEKGWSTPVQLAPLRPDPTLDAGSRHVRYLGLMTLFSTIFTIPVLIMAWAPLPERGIAYGSASLALATVVQVVVAGPFYPKALKDLIFSRTAELDMLIVLSTSAAYVFSVVSFGYMVAGKPLATGEFFETSTLLVTIIMVGRFISALARQKAAESISIRSLQTHSAILVDEEDNEKEVDARLLQYGDVFKVVPATRVPTDGTVISGYSEVDESMMTGESIPVEKLPGSPIIAGSINGSGTLVVRLTRLPGDNTISTIAAMVDEAKLSKTKIQDLADYVASYFVPVVVVLTIITFIIWVTVGVAIRKQSGSTATVQALTYAITVLIVSCPCAIGLAVPMVVVIASGVAAQRGVIFKSATSIEVAHKTTDVVFDKTGTLTRGELNVAFEEYFVENLQETKSLLLGLVGSIKHPVSAAIAARLKEAGTLPSTVQNSQSLPGKGVEATFSNQKLCAGNSRWLDCTSHPGVQGILSQALTALCFTIDGNLAAVYGLEDSLRSDAFTTVSALQQAGIRVHILSGDGGRVVRNVASQLHIPDAQVRSRCSPADKQAYIKSLLECHNNSAKKREPPTVIFVGDGTNDAVALAQATIGIHISTGTDVAKSAADVVLIRPNLSGVLTVITISTKAIHRIVFNFVWSFVYNLFAVLLAAGAFVHARIPPEFAGLGELVSVLPVIAAAVALRWTKV